MLNHFIKRYKLELQICFSCKMGSWPTHKCQQLDRHQEVSRKVLTVCQKKSVKLVDFYPPPFDELIFDNSGCQQPFLQKSEQSFLSILVECKDRQNGCQLLSQKRPCFFCHWDSNQGKPTTMISAFEGATQTAQLSSH